MYCVMYLQSNAYVGTHVFPGQEYDIVTSFHSPISMLPRPCYSIISKVNSADQFILLANTSQVCIILSMYIVARWSGMVYCRFFIIMAATRYYCSNYVYPCSV